MEQGNLNFSGKVEPTHMARVEHPPRGDNPRWHSKWLQWKMDHGLSWRGTKPPDWKPQPTNLLAKIVCALGRIK